MKLDTLAGLNAERAARRAAILVTRLRDNSQVLVRAEDIAEHPLSDQLAERLRSGKSALVVHEGQDYFLTVQVPPLCLILIGAVHISQALVPMAEAVALDVTVIDPRTAFATAARFPGVALVPDWPDTALRDLDRFSALAALTHDPKIDDPALIAALNAGCTYVGALGSRRTHERRVERLLQAGLDPVRIARIHAPIGLDIGAVSPAEIAVSILAQVIATLRRRQAGDA